MELKSMKHKVVLLKILVLPFSVFPFFFTITNNKWGHKELPSCCTSYFITSLNHRHLLLR